MKKYLAIVLGVLLILSFAVVASAQDKPEITLGGKILVRGWYFDNVSGPAAITTDEISGLLKTLGIGPISPTISSSILYDNLPVEAGSQAMYSTNAYFTIDAKVADNVRGFMELETSGGDSVTSGLYYWGNHDAKPNADLLFRQLWLQYTGSGLLSVPTSLKAGHMLLTLSEKQFLNHERFGDDMILLTVEPTKELLIGLLTAKLKEGSIAVSSDDLDAYILLGTYKLDKDNTFGLNYTLIHSDGLSSLDVVESLSAGEVIYTPSVDTLNFQNLGLHANGKVSGVSYAAEVDFQFGKAKALPGGEDTKFSGYGILAKLGYKVDPVNLRASFAMGSGDNTADDKNKEFQALVGNDNQGATARFPHYTQLYERAIRTAANGQTLTGNTRTTGIANTTYYNIGADIDPVKDLSLSLDGYIIRATKAWQAEQSKSVGSEVDLTASYKIAKNLTYFVQAGVFTPGKFYTTGAEPVNGGFEKKTATMAVHGLCLTF